MSKIVKECLEKGLYNKLPFHLVEAEVALRKYQEQQAKEWEKVRKDCKTLTHQEFQKKYFA